MKPQTKLTNFIKEEIMKITNAINPTSSADARDEKVRLLIKVQDKINEVYE